MAPDSLNITDNRTGSQYELPIADGAIRAADLRQIKTSADDFGLLSYDPSLLNTATVRSSVTYIDGDAGILRYRGYPIEQLAEHSTYLEVVYLLLNGELPNTDQLLEFEKDIRYRTMVLENVRKMMETYRYDAHPMGMLVSMMGTMSTYYPEARNVADPEARKVQTVRAIGKVATVAAWCYRHTLSYPFIYPDNDLTYFRQLPEHAVPHGGAEVRAESRYRAGHRRAVHPARGSRAEREHECDARHREFTIGSLLSLGGRDWLAVRPVARRRE